MGAARQTQGVTASEEIDYRIPPAKALERGKDTNTGPDVRDRETTAKALLESLEHFGVEARLLGVVSGPHVSRYELQLAPGTKVSKVAALKDDLAYALASTDIRILAPIPGKKAVGVEVPNSRRKLVRLGDIYGERTKGASPLLAWLGKDVSGQNVSADLALMPHILVAGTTGSGKSGCINAILSSILMHASPNEVRFVLVDPKQVELNHYERLPHLLTPVVTAPRLAATVLANLIGEMESRYAVMSQARARNLVELNKARRKKRRAAAAAHPLRDRRARRPDDGRAGRGRGLDHPPRAEGAGDRHPPRARDPAAVDRRDHGHDQGQHPVADRVRGRLPGRLAGDPRRRRRREPARPGRHAVPADRDLEAPPDPGSVRLRGGDRPDLQLLGEAGRARVRRGAARGAASPRSRRASSGEFSPDQDDLLADAARIVVESETASVSMIQRRLRVGYTRAGRLIDMLERRGIISGYEGSKPRQVLVSLRRPGADPRRRRGQRAASRAANEPPTDSELEPVGDA